MAWCVTTVLRQQHTDMHLVRLAFQVLKEALDAIPVVVPFTLPQRRTIDDPRLLLFR